MDVTKSIFSAADAVRAKAESIAGAVQREVESVADAVQTEVESVVREVETRATTMSEAVYSWNGKPGDAVKAESRNGAVPFGERKVVDPFPNEKPQVPKRTPEEERMKARELGLKQHIFGKPGINSWSDVTRIFDTVVERYGHLYNVAVKKHHGDTADKLVDRAMQALGFDVVRPAVAAAASQAEGSVDAIVDGAFDAFFGDVSEPVRPLEAGSGVRSEAAAPLSPEMTANALGVASAHPTGRPLAKAIEAEAMRPGGRTKAEGAVEARPVINITR